MEANNKRILKNTVYLYLRMIVMMALSFISTRIVLDKLGIDDYGVYNIVGGFVALFTILNNVLLSATRRFMAIAIGKNDAAFIQKTFITSFTMHLVVAFIVVLLLETLGLWLLNTQLNFSPDRIQAANWVFQISIFTVFISITQTPYTSAVTAHERFNIYAFMSIYDVIAKIAILFILIYLPGDKLIIYAILLSIVSVTGMMIYRVYCQRQFVECKSLSVRADKTLFKEMLKFSGWDSFGNITVILNAQGTSVLLNMFFNTAVNASRGIAGHVTSVISNFVTGFVTAAEPQLAKYYVQKDKLRFERLIFNISQLTLFMLAIFAVPVFFEIDFVLQLWLGQVPDYTPEFIKITIITCFIQYSAVMLIKGNVAIGRVKELSLLVSPTSLLNLPLVYMVLKLGWNPTAVYWVASIPSLLNMFMNLYILGHYEKFPVREYLFKIFFKNVALVCVACILPYIVRQNMAWGWTRFLVVCGVSVLSVIVVLWIFALNKETREMVLRKIIKKKTSNVVE